MEAQTRTDQYVRRPARDRLIATLRRHLPALKQQYHIKSLGLFGSYIRNEQTAESDVDLLVEFDEVPGLLTYVELQQALSDLLHLPVDLVHRPDLKPYIGERILAEVVPL
jgi:predicted nucleotidyltransferase